MTKTLVVVESPAKAKTIEKYLGDGYAVRASYGHIRDLPRSKLGVDPDQDFAVQYEVPEDSKRHVADLKKALKQNEDLVLATDYDREGEAIAFHVATLLGVEPADAKRVTFTEITRDAILDAFAHPRTIDMELFDAQEARRILDRLVGYKISPLLWKRVQPGLSAGRVQSVAVRLIVEREREIDAFVPVEYWSIDVRLTPEDVEQPFLARLTEVPEGKLAAGPDKKGLLLGTEGDAAQHAERLREASYRVIGVEKKERKRSPAPPFTTSTLQQEAARKLGFSARKTMTLAQRLYEGIDLPGEGTSGLITYMRTDSVTIADSALREIAELVQQDYGKAYSLAEARRYKTRSRNAQEAHEAVRPTSVFRTPQRVAAVLERDQLRLYTLNWQRTVATQMADARFDQVGIDIEALAPAGVGGSEQTRYGLRATGQTLTFDGFLKLYREGRDDEPDEDAEAALPVVTAEQLLRMLEVLPEQHFTQPPPRYTEASLVKKLEELGIGRPSTYASIISTIQDRGYVRLEDRAVPTRRRWLRRDRQTGRALPGHRQPRLHRVHGEGARRHRRRPAAERSRCSEEFNGPFERSLEKAEDSFERYSEELDELCPLCPQRGERAGEAAGQARPIREAMGCPNYRNAATSATWTAPGAPSRSCRRDCPDCGRPAPAPRRSLRAVRRISGLPGVPLHQEGPADVDECDLPQCHQGELMEKRTRFGNLLRMRPLIHCQLA